MTQYTRRDHLVTNQDTYEQVHYNSINQAKRATRKLKSEGHDVTKLQSKNTRLHVKVYSK